MGFFTYHSKDAEDCRRGLSSSFELIKNFGEFLRIHVSVLLPRAHFVGVDFAIAKYEVGAILSRSERLENQIVDGFLGVEPLVGLLLQGFG